MEQVGKRWLAGPLLRDEDGQLLTKEGPSKVNPALGFGVRRREMLRAAGDLKRSPTNAAAAIHSPANLPRWGSFAIVVRMFQEGPAEGSLAFAIADHRTAYNQAPVCEGREKLAVVSLREPKSYKMRGLLRRRSFSERPRRRRSTARYRK